MTKNQSPAMSWLAELKYRRAELGLLRAMYGTSPENESLRGRQNRCERLTRAAEFALSVLDPDERAVCELMLIEKKRGAVQELVERLNLSQRAIYKLRKSAIEKIERTLGL